MGRPGSALDNAAIEAFHSTLTFELLRLETFPTKPAARRRVAEWIDEYNRERRHSALAMRSPLEFEHAHRGGSDADPRPRQPPAVLAGVKAKPSGRPSAGPDTGCGRWANHGAGTAKKNGQHTKIRLTEVSTVRGDCPIR